MRKKRTGIKITAAAAWMAAGLILPGLHVRAAEAYTVTYRPGNVGIFAVSEEGSIKEKAEEVAAINYGGYETEVTEHGAIRVKVPAGSPAPAAPSQIAAQEGYFAKDASQWGPSGEEVDRNLDYVADYGKLVDGVEYTIEYVDGSSGESIAPVYIARANRGEKRKAEAPERIVVSGGTAYSLVSERTLEKELGGDASENVFTFRYALETGEATEEERITYVDGGTVTETETVIRTVGNGQTAAAAGTAGTPGGAGAGPAADAEEGEEGGPGQTEIPEEDPPLAAGIPEEGEEGTVTIEEEGTPLAAGPAAEAEGNTAVTAAAAIVSALAVGTGCFWLVVRKKRKRNTE